jgi:hypothetical protein
MGELQRFCIFTLGSGAGFAIRLEVGNPYFEHLIKRLK